MKNIRLVLFTLAVVFIFTAVFLFWGQEVNKELKVVFFDVGQGDSAFIKTPHGQDIIIDGGPDNVVLGKIGENMGIFNNDIELMILTHPHEDHVTGLVEVINRYEIERVIYSGIIYDSEIYKIFLEKIREEGAEIIIAKKSERIRMADDLYLEILYPNRNISENNINNINDTSVVVRLVHGENSFLFMGDAESSVEREIWSNGLSSQVLKVSHHGSKTNNADFLKMISPEYSVISVGEKNRFGHPSVLVTNTLKNINSKVLRTDELGDLYFFSDGEDLRASY